MFNPMETVKDEAEWLNMTIDDTMKGFEHLRTENVGAILVITRIADETRTGIPFLTLLAAPLMVTYNLITGDAEVLMDDVWDEMILDAFKPHLDTSEVHCPLIGGTGRIFEISNKLEPKVFSLLQDSQPLLLQAGELTCATVMQGEHILPCRISLPEVCNLPIGMRWPVDIGIKDFLCSIQGAYSQSSTIFQHVIMTFEPAINNWFHVMSDNTDFFIIQ
jgi:hypothetical protein